MVQNDQELKRLIRDTAIQCLLHCKEHGDPRLTDRFLHALGKGRLAESFRDWVWAFSPIRWNGDGQIGVVKPTNTKMYNPFNITGALTNDFDKAGPHHKSATAEIVTEYSGELWTGKRIGKAIAQIAKRIQGNRIVKIPLLKKLESSVAQLIPSVPARSHLELLSMYQKCAEHIVERRSFGGSPVEHLRDAIVSEWQRRHIAGDFFKWPNTLAPIGSGALTHVSSPEFGMFAALGYRVGRTRGGAEAQRQFLLDQVFSIHLPPLNGPAYMREWGTPRTASRLRKMADALASFARNAKRDTLHDKRLAILQWEADLDYLHRKYYVDHFRFGWQGTD